MGSKTIVGKLAVFPSRTTESGREHVSDSQADQFDVADKHDFHRSVQTGFATHEQAFMFCIVNLKKHH